MAPPLTAALRRQLLLPHRFSFLPSRYLSLSTANSLSDQSDFEYDHPLSPAPNDDGELTSFVRRISHASSAASSPKDALSQLLSSSSRPSPASPSLLVRALWELRGDPEAVALALRWGDECSATSWAEGTGSLPAEAWHLAIWAAGRAGRFDLAWAAVRRMLRRGVLTRRAMVILMERCGRMLIIFHHFAILDIGIP
jgi:hypothetical protein